MTKQTCATILLFAFTVLLAAEDKSQTYKGEIMDDKCAAMASHDAMMKSEGGPKSAKDCTLACVKMGAKYVLYDPDTKTVYALDNQEKPKAFAGQKVKMTGKFDETNKVLHFSRIVPLG